ncbi:bacillithiol system redox-active protein YtxJ [Pedobacter cryophilus]|uniref:Bacillithiol system redox-active protein YtxJ n=1 Tax=Pedobacter cryophilus TaxID=2571271 RepID=A0A4U1C0W0_9SPHI|nr:bacillithiol system redox-active protein YtxJ [Pedobacter cryophilus]TKB98584.1 bacillithiol system redox-active protein YtxJ [Pedobacter cryophilus]
MNWIKLESEEQINEIKNDAGYSIIFKHSTRCSISMMAKKRVEMDADELPQEIKPYFLDLIAFRDLSSLIAETFQVHHESPQLLLIKNGECLLDQSHGDISIEETVEVVQA